MLLMDSDGAPVQFESIRADNRNFEAMSHLYASCDCVYTGMPWGKITKVSSPSHSLNQNIENRVEDKPHINFTGTSPRFRLWDDVTEKFILGKGQVAPGSATSVALLVLFTIYSSAYTERAFLQTARLFKHPLKNRFLRLKWNSTQQLLSAKDILRRSKYLLLQNKLLPELLLQPNLSLNYIYELIMHLPASSSNRMVGRPRQSTPVTALVLVRVKSGTSQQLTW